MDARKLDWDRDCGDMHPATVAADIRDTESTPREYAEGYLAEWPFDAPPPADLVDGMTAAIEAEMDVVDPDDVCGC